jgi:hypothetical protein
VERDQKAAVPDIITDADRLAWVSLASGGQRTDYAMHVLQRGGTGDLSDIRSFIDKAIRPRAQQPSRRPECDCIYCRQERGEPRDA